MAAKLNYHPNPAGKALAARKKHPVVGVLLLSEGVHFFDDVLHSMHRLADKYDSYGLKVIWRSMRGFDIDKQCAMIDELREQGINALIIDRSPAVHDPSTGAPHGRPARLAADARPPPAP